MNRFTFRLTGLFFRRVLTDVREQAERTRQTLLAVERRLMNKGQEIKDEIAGLRSQFGASATTLEEIRTDVDDLILKVGDPSENISAADQEAILASLKELRTKADEEAVKLTEIAAKHTPETTEPPAEPV